MKISIESSVTSCVSIVPVRIKTNDYEKLKQINHPQETRRTKSDSFLPGNELMKMKQNTKPRKSQEAGGIRIDIAIPYRIARSNPINV